MISYARRSIWLVLVFSLANLGCSKDKAAPQSSEATATQPAQTNPANPAAKPVEPAGPPMHVDAARTMQYTREIVAFGPRWDGSKALDQVRAYIKNKLKNDRVEEDSFVAETSIGKVPMTNIVAKFPGSKDGIIVLGSHYETNYWLKDTSFVGANDGACTTALLLAIADQLRGKKLEGYSIWLAFFDGEESMRRQWDTADALWGSRHLAQKWKDDGTSKKIKGLLLADMIGDANLRVMRDENSTPWLEDMILQAATRLGYQSFFFREMTAVQDDHLPFVKVDVPVADIIDGAYGYNDSFHHTPEDTLDKLSVKSLQVSGDVILETIRLLNGMGDNPPPSRPQKVPS
ncbi:MAG TPA: M28 family peptidase [Candidatus Angelobacter sp.]|nr:M28 family peptidase [Candidatus Angelobacter sp.]